MAVLKESLSIPPDKVKDFKLSPLESTDTWITFLAQNSSSSPSISIKRTDFCSVSTSMASPSSSPSSSGRVVSKDFTMSITAKLVP
ncbi:hypothetical protein WICPIJ_003721 [Wickerhamomyces pijperi]|uniref:Uncharacterized protein n=1 Tax=Wickerhamomyces pijperi TaxID=599730 RepID=A0A9P8TMR7_WICPI|nr:hypothetical protein WICPIJ_003721 [Wickerhamomyces pijperi]